MPQSPQLRSVSHRLVSVVVGAFAALMALPAHLAYSAVSDLPELGDPAATVLSPDEEAQLGRRFMRAARQQLAFVTDPELDDYIRRLGTAIARVTSAEDPNYRFYLIRNKELNAFAVPGGHIAVHTGLVLAAKTEDELAGVMAHEIAHLRQHHMARLVAQSKSLTIPAIAAIVAGVLLGGQAGVAAIAATNAALVDNQLRYTRDFEREADRIGMQFLAQAGFSPAAMPSFFEQLQQWSRVQEGNAPEFLRTHPITSDRIAEAQSRAESLPAPAQARSDMDFRLVRAKIRALYADPAQDLLKELEEGSSGDAPEVVRYGKAVLLARLGRYDAARREWAELRKTAPERLAYHIGLVQTEIVAHDYRSALDNLLAAEKHHPADPVLALYHADTLLKTGQPQAAQPRLRALLKSDPANPLLYQMLARAEGDAGNMLGMHRNLAEYHHLNGNTSEALRQLRLAKQYTGESYYATAGLEARIAEVETEVRENAKEERQRAPESSEPKRRR
jgi:predicted Zn-dependent protease